MRELNEMSMDHKFLITARLIVERNIGNSSFGVEQMADEIHLSRSQMFRKMKALIGITPSEFINHIRLEKAAQLIRMKSDTLSQIGYSVGYNEQSYFAKKFRKKFGVSPKEFQTIHYQAAAAQLEEMSRFAPQNSHILSNTQSSIA